MGTFLSGLDTGATNLLTQRLKGIKLRAAKVLEGKQILVILQWLRKWA
jgi:hypothetical protein